MSESDTRLTLLFDRYYSNIASDSEINELMGLIDALDDVDCILQLLNLHQMESQFSNEESEALFNSVTNLKVCEEIVGTGSKKNGIRYLRWIQYAAAVALLIFGASLIWKLENIRNIIDR